MKLASPHHARDGLMLSWPFSKPASYEAGVCAVRRVTA
jgi:hypothetical protein